MLSASHSAYLVYRFPPALEWARGRSAPGYPTMETLGTNPPRLTNSLSTVAGMTALYWWLNWYDHADGLPEGLSNSHLLEKLIDYHLATTGEGTD